MAAFGIDTSVFVGLLAEQPADQYACCVERLTALIGQGSRAYVSSLVIGEAYFALQHHYGVSEPEARNSIERTLRSGLVSPAAGDAVFDLLAAAGGAGLVDRFIAMDYAHNGNGMVTLTRDRLMANLPGGQWL